MTDAEPPTDADQGDPVARATRLLCSEGLADVERAEQLLLVAMARDPRARPLAAAAYDRRRMLRGLPQKFGTQRVVRAGRGELWPVDPTTTDSERAKWGLPPLSQLRRSAEGPAE